MAQSQENGVQVAVATDAKEKNILPRGVSLYPHKKAGLMHRKIVLIDDSLILLGSTNITSSAFYLHKNSLLAFRSKLLAEAVRKEETLLQKTFSYYPLPTYKKEAISFLFNSIQNAKTRIYLAQYTLTHPLITEELINAHNRGVEVRIFLDRQQAKGASKKTKENLLAHGLFVATSRGKGLLHHKCALIDNTFITGSANWTKAGMQTNQEYLLFLFEPPEPELKKILAFFDSCKKFSSAR